MTRAFCSISHGQFAQAWHLNPASFLFYAMTVMGLAYPFFAKAIPEKLIRAIVFGAIAVLLVFGGCRMVLTPLSNQKSHLQNLWL
jgi:hypothetical protein